MIVAIDGPAGSGKSTVTHLLAQRLGYFHIDTGALYRAVALQALEQKIPLEDGVRLGKLAESCHLEFKWSGGDKSRIFLDGKDVSGLIRTPEIGMAASKVSSHSDVRKALLSFQQDLGHQYSKKGFGVVLEGRDIGTVIFPDADIKFYLTASVDTRAKRRMLELQAKGAKLSFDEVKKQVVGRDHADMTRTVAPLKKATDAVEVDTTSMTIDEVVETLSSLIKEKYGKKKNKNTCNKT